MKATVCLVLFLALPTICLASTWNVPGDFATIQAAVDAASNGDLILVAAGSYDEQVTIDAKNLEIKGAGAGATKIVSPPVLAVTFITSADNKCVVGVINGGNLVLRNLTVDGAGLGNSNYRFIGVGFRNAGGLVSYCTVKNIEDTPFSGSQHGVGIYAFNDDGTDRAITLNHANVTTYQKTGIALNGANVVATLQSCLTLGAGPTAVTAQNGIQLAYDTNGTIDGCSVYNNCYTGASWTASGILLYDAAVVDVKNCPVIKDNQMGTYFITTDGTFIDNKILAGVNAQGDGGYYYGLSIDDQGAHGPAAQVFGDGMTAGKGRTTTTVTVADSIFDADQTGHGSGVSTWAQASDNVVADVIGCSITDWEWGMEVWDDGTAAASVNVYQCTISGNTGNGLINYTANVVEARHNNWGDPSGPYHPTLNPTGLGDEVSDTVDFIPWITGQESLTADRYIIHAAAADTLNFTLDAGPAQSNRNYILLGNATGTEPGLTFAPGVVLPLNWDPVTDLMLALANTPALVNFKSLLDGSGTATAQFNTLGPLPPTAVGVTLNLAYLLYLPSVDFASNAVSCKVVM